MNVVKSTRSAIPKAAIDENSARSKINLYQDFPNAECSLEEFEEAALARLKVCG